MSPKQRAAIYAKLAAVKLYFLTVLRSVARRLRCAEHFTSPTHRPTKQGALFFQQVGRGLQISPETERQLPCSRPSEQ